MLQFGIQTRVPALGGRVSLWWQYIIIWLLLISLIVCFLKISKSLQTNFSTWYIIAEYLVCSDFDIFINLTTRYDTQLHFILIFWFHVIVFLNLCKSYVCFVCVGFVCVLTNAILSFVVVRCSFFVVSYLTVTVIIIAVELLHIEESVFCILNVDCVVARHKNFWYMFRSLMRISFYFANNISIQITTYKGQVSTFKCCMLRIFTTTCFGQIVLNITNVWCLSIVLFGPHTW